MMLLSGSRQSPQLSVCQFCCLDCRYQGAPAILRRYLSCAATICNPCQLIYQELLQALCIKAVFGVTCDEHHVLYPVRPNWLMPCLLSFDLLPDVALTNYLHSRQYTDE